MHLSRRLLIALAASATSLFAVGHAAAAPEQPPTLSVTADGCDITFTTVGGQGAADGWSATFSVDGDDAGTWSSADDIVVLTNWISRDFTPGGTLTVTWEVFALPSNDTLDTGATSLTVPPCDPPYQIRVDKVVAGQVPAAGYTVDVWAADGDGGTSCAPAPANATRTVGLPAAGGSAAVRVSPGHWCVQETERRGALTTTYSSAGGTMLGDAHLVTVAPAPGTTVVTITNTFAAAAGPVTNPTLPSTGTTDTLVGWAAALTALGTAARRLSRRAVV
jgi:hypothetical protein